MAWYKVAPVQESEKDYIKKVTAGSKTICLVKSTNHYYALSNKCPHAGAELSGGWCEQGKLVCPFHRYAYDLQTGKGNAGQNDYVNTYCTELRDDGVYVEVRSAWERLTNAFK